MLFFVVSAIDGYNLTAYELIAYGLRAYRIKIFLANLLPYYHNSS